ncbi:hypothetical protein BZA77DRAFT_362631 [Pyronema omphalodes]|nr:hypothetical protein BZA77DRAFT_362631 [Pyronema omphalodes]
MLEPSPLLDLPINLLCDIVELVDPVDQSALRQTCWTTRMAVLPFIFRTVTLDFSRKDIVRLQLQSLAIDNGISRVAVKAYTRELHIVLSSERTESKRSLSEQSLPDATPFSYAHALSAFQNLKSLKITNGSKMRCGGYDAIAPVLHYLASFNTLRGLDISLSTMMDGISSRHSPSGLTLPVNTTDSKIENPFVSLIATSPGITVLKLRAWPLDYRDDPVAFESLFSNICPLSLHALHLCGAFRINAAGVRSLLPHLSQLRELSVNGEVDNISLLWPALQTAGIELEVLHAKGKASRPLLRYLSSFSKLRELSISSAYNFDLRDYIPDIAMAIREHAPNLRELDIVDELASGWAFDIEDILMECIYLKRLAVTVFDIGSVFRFRNLAHAMPFIRILQLDLSAPRRTESGEIQEVPPKVLAYLTSANFGSTGRLMKIECHASDHGSHGNPDGHADNDEDPGFDLLPEN